MLLTGYAVLDGFDLGTGPLLLCTRQDRDRRILLNAIDPIWNGNEVWLVTGGGALFAAFPGVYATVFSAFYDAFMLLLFALISRSDPGKREGADILTLYPAMDSSGNTRGGLGLNCETSRLKLGRREIEVRRSDRDAGW